MIGLVQLNVWLDVVFVALYVVILIALGGHFVGNILTGRAKRRFIDWQWPHHDGPPVPVLPKLLHFQHVAAMILLAVSGLYIRFPAFEGARTPMRWIHYFAMIVVCINLVWRLWYAFYSQQRDYREFAITGRDITTMPKVILYYIFVKPSKPHLGKYNVMQKSTYIMFVPLLIIQAITGFALLTMVLPLVNMSPRELIVGWSLGTLLQSTDLAGWWARTIHYIVNWLFIILTTIHVYLSVSEDLPAFLSFFGLEGLVKKEDEHHGIDPAHDPMAQEPTLATPADH